MIVLMMVVNVSLLWYLVMHIGAMGFVIGLVVGVFLFELLVNW